MKKLIYGIWLITVTLLVSCSEKGEQFKIDGHITSANGKTLLFESITLNGVKQTDSVKLDANGQFSFCDAKAQTPEFYRLRIDGEIINLAIDSTEHIRVEADLPTMSTDYHIEGSENCEVIRDLSNKQIALQKEIRSISRNQNLTIGEKERIITEKVVSYKNDLKRNYIIKNPGASYAYFALFQTIGGRLLFNPVDDAEDVKFVGAVATAWEERYPGAIRTENLHNIAIQGLKNTKERKILSFDDIDPEKISAAGIIDIALPDAKGHVRRISDIKNKVVMLDFTVYAAPESKERILRQRELYNRFASKGFEIYQVSIDPDVHYWKTAQEHLPWICVHEANAESSEYIRSYRLTRIPTYFLVNRKGDLVARDEQVDDLEKTIRNLCTE